MEHPAAVLAVGDPLEPQGFLHLHRVADVPVLDGPKILARNLARLALRSRL
jgi:hypothetical protein